jgi:pantoate--beta-alanine ligase
MLVCRKFQEIRKYLDEQVGLGKTIGFVPTMGALHAGHVSLIEKSNATADVTVCSIFVNPTQFNNSTDLDQYPRTEEEDVKMLEAHNCDLVFIPDVLEVYPKGYTSPKIDLDGLDLVMEGEFRPGHFCGVTQVVGRFFEQIRPDFSFFGEKDYQQLEVIKKMVSQREFKSQIIGCDILREKSGLAMSSRNVRLSEKGMDNAILIIEQLTWAKNNYANLSIKEIVRAIESAFEEHPEFVLEYFEIVDASTLHSVQNKLNNARAFIAVDLEEVRLIDNIALNY